jgi:hypothetical protein
MSHCRPWMLLLCAVALGLVLFLPRLGLAAGGSSLAVAVLMAICCGLPMLFALGRRSDGCCADEKEGPAEPDRHGGAKAQDTSSDTR